MIKEADHTFNYFSKFHLVIEKIKIEKINSLVDEILKIKKNNGRIFFIGVGGSAGNCSHAVNDFRKICEINCYTPTDNVSELTARINDDGWNSSFANWLKVSKLNSKDGIFVMSVGGGNLKKKVSVNIVNAIKYSKLKKAKIFGIVGRDGGYTKKKGDQVILIPTLEKKFSNTFLRISSFRYLALLGFTSKASSKKNEVVK